MAEPGLDPSPIAQLRAFRAFQAGIRDRGVVSAEVHRKINRKQT